MHKKYSGIHHISYIVSFSMSCFMFDSCDPIEWYGRKWCPKSFLCQWHAAGCPHFHSAISGQPICSGMWWWIFLMFPKLQLLKISAGKGVAFLTGILKIRHPKMIRSGFILISPIIIAFVLGVFVLFLQFIYCYFTVQKVSWGNIPFY